MKNLYKRFNQIQIDSQIEPMEVDDLEKERIKRTVLKGNKKNNPFRNFAVAAAILVVCSLTLTIAFPSFAEKLIGDIFELFNDDKQYVFEEHPLYTTEIGSTVESNGIKVTITDAVYDGENIIIAYLVESDELPIENPILEGKLTADEFGEAYKYHGFFTHDLTEKINEKQYASLFVFEMIQGPKPSELNVKWDTNLLVNKYNYYEQVEGEWSFEFTLEALERESENLRDYGYKTEADGIDITLTKLTKTPISTTFYLNEKVDERVVAMEEEDFRVILIEYNVTDNLGNELNFIHYRDTGHSTDFPSDHRGYPRLTMKVFDDEATSLTITPVVHVLKIVEPDSSGGGLLGPVMEPFEIDPIVFPLTDH